MQLILSYLEQYLPKLVSRKVQYFVLDIVFVIKIYSIFALHFKMVAWPSGLGSGLQNHLRRFESARDLELNPSRKACRGFLFLRMMLASMSMKQKIP